MRNKIVFTLLVSVLATSPLMAAESASRQEAIGVGTGAAVGAVVGGPVGLMIGAAIGAKLGNEYGRKDAQIGTLSTSLSGSQARIGELERDAGRTRTDLDTLQAELERAEAKARPELVDLMQAGIEMDLLFRTDEHVLTGATGSRIGQLAASLATMPDIRIQLDGFADERGDADYNQTLSAKRVEHVRQILLTNGVEESRIEQTAHGESAAAEASVDSYALERKVSLTLYVEQSPSFASNPR